MLVDDQAGVVTPTQLRHHVMLEMRCDLTALDLDALDQSIRPLAPMGVIITTLQDELVIDPASGRHIYDCHMCCRRQQPPTALRQDPIPWERWESSFLTRPDAMPQAYFVAKYGNDYVGVCALVVDESYSDRWVSGFTGTLPAWQGRGIARALKAQSLQYAAHQHITAITTHVLQINQVMVAINRALGFQVLRRQRHAYQVPIY